MRPMIWIAAVLCLVPLSACGAQSSAAVPGGDAQRGAKLIYNVGCGACHEIPGIPDAVGKVGPPLDNIGDRVIIAGLLPNTPTNMIAWITNPQAIVPGNAMPDLGLTDSEARDIAAYLYTLR